MLPSSSTCKVKENHGMYKILAIFNQKVINGLDHGLGQPAAAKSGQKQPGLEVRCLDRTDRCLLLRQDRCLLLRQGR